MVVKTLKGTHTMLRALEPEDLEILYELENDESVWEVSNTVAPYSKFVLRQYLDNAHRDIFEIKQLRLVIVINEITPIGFIDLFDFDPKNRRVGVGIIIFSQARNRGFANESLKLLCSYAFNHLNVHQVYAHITADNAASIALFEKLGFVKAGIKKDWVFSSGTYKDEHIYQKFNYVS